MGTKKYAEALWIERYGNKEFAVDFAGNLMHFCDYGIRNHYINHNGKRIYCGWNLYHIMAKSKGGTLDKNNILLTNFIINDKAMDKTTFTIDGVIYQINKNNSGTYNLYQI